MWVTKNRLVIRGYITIWFACRPANVFVFPGADYTRVTIYLGSLGYIICRVVKAIDLVAVKR